MRKASILNPRTGVLFNAAILAETMERMLVVSLERLAPESFWIDKADYSVLHRVTTPEVETCDNRKS